MYDLFLEKKLGILKKSTALEEGGKYEGSKASHT